MNNIEDGIYNAHEEINTLKNNTSTGGSNINDTTASATTTYSSNKIENIKEDLVSQIRAIGGSGGSSGEVDLSGYVTKELGNASQITFADGQTFQDKLDAGTLKGDKGDKGDPGANNIEVIGQNISSKKYTNINKT